MSKTSQNVKDKKSLNNQNVIKKELKDFLK